MSYNDRIDDGYIYDDDQDSLVTHEGRIYLSLNNEVFLPLMIREDEPGRRELYVDRQEKILGKTSVQKEIDALKTKMGDTDMDIQAQYDIPNLDTMESLALSLIQDQEQVDQEQESYYDPEEQAEAEAEPELEAEPEAEADADEPVNIEFEYGEADAVVNVSDGEDEFNLDDLLDELMADDIIIHSGTGSIVKAQQAVYSDQDVNQVVNLIPEFREISNPLSLRKIQTVVRSMIQNIIEDSKHKSLGAKIFHIRGLPEWLIPVACSKVNADADADRRKASSSGCYENQNSDTGGCYINVDVPNPHAPHADIMVPDRPNEAPGKWRRARGEYAVNVIHNVNEDCALSVSDLHPIKIHREMAPEYEIHINLSPVWKKKVEQKSLTDKKDTETSQRLRCGRAYAHAVAEPGGVGSISVDRRGTEKKLHVTGLLVRDINHTSARPVIRSDNAQILPIQCTGKYHNGDFSAVVDSVVKEILKANLTDDFFAMCHNLSPVDRFLNRFKMDLRDLDVSTVNRLQEILNTNHPVMVYNYCKTCEKMSTGETCQQCQKVGESVEWSSFHTDKMGQYKHKYDKARHPKRGTLDHGHHYYCDSLRQYITKHQKPDEPEHQDKPTFDALVPVRPLAIQLYMGKLYYLHESKLYSREEYKQLQANSYYVKHRNSIKNYPLESEVKETCQLAALSYRQREVQHHNAAKRLLGGLVIDIITDIPKGSVVVQYMDRLLESGDTPMYLEYLQEFLDSGIITYDAHHGRYASTESDEIIMCICHKTYIEQQNKFAGVEEFLVGNKCKYCLTILNNEEQITDFSNLTDRDIYAGESQDTDDDYYIGLNTMLIVILELLETLMQTHGWTLTDSDKNFILDQLKNADEINVDPYGKHGSGTRTAVSDKTSDLRGFIQQQPLPAILTGKKKLRIKSEKTEHPLKIKGETFDIKNMISLYLKATLPGSWPSGNGEKLLDVTKSMFQSTKGVLLTESKVAIMSYYTLPILRLQGINISLIFAYLTSFLELKYGTKEQVDEDVFMTILMNYVDTEFVHQACNLYSEKMHTKYTSLLHMLNVMSAEQQAKKSYFNKIGKLYQGRQGELQCFNEEFTEHYEILLRSGKKGYFDSLRDSYKQELKLLRTNQEYTKKVPGQKVVVRDNLASLYYNQAPTWLLSEPGDTYNFDDYENCVASTHQRVMGEDGYLIALRQLYAEAEKIKDVEIGDQGTTVGSLLATQCTEDCVPPVLGHMALYGCVAQGIKLMTLGNTEYPEDYEKFESTIEEYELTLTDLPAPPEQECSFIPEALKKYVHNSSKRVYPHLRQGSFNVPIAAGQNMLLPPAQRQSIDMLKERVYTINKDYLDDPKFVNRMKRLHAYQNDDLVKDNDVNGIFEGKRRNYCFNVIPETSYTGITKSYNEPYKKAREMRNIHAHSDITYQKVPSYMAEDDDTFLYPWGELAVLSLVLRRVKRCQNIGKMIAKIIRWLGRLMTDEEMNAMKQSIHASNKANVVGADREFKMEKDQITPQGYILTELYDLKLVVQANHGEKAANAKLDDYEPHNVSLYDMGYDDYKTLVHKKQLKDSDGEFLDSQTNFLDLIYMCIKVDIMKHLEFIGQGQKTPDAPVQTGIQYNVDVNQTSFIEIVGKIIDSLNNNAGPSVVDPNRADIDKLYELRFYEFANKRSVTTAKVARKKTGIDINTAYAGVMHGEVQIELGIDESEYDPEGEGEPESQEQDVVPDDEWDLDDLPEGMENIFGDAGDYDPEA
jgi:hypothetical protein